MKNKVRVFRYGYFNDVDKRKIKWIEEKFLEIKDRKRMIYIFIK